MPGPTTKILEYNYSVFEYLYRDACNYKAHGVLLLAGHYSGSIRNAIVKTLSDGEYFIPEQVELASLQPVLYPYSDGPNDDDHPWHEFVDLRSATLDEVAEMEAHQTVAELLTKFLCVESWAPTR